jgi:hypothetical protein
VVFVKKLIISLCILGFALTGCTGSEEVAVEFSDVPSAIEEKVDHTLRLQLIYGKNRDKPYVIYQSDQKVDYVVDITDDTYTLKLTETSEEGSLHIFQINTSDTDIISVYLNDIETAFDVVAT